MPFILLGIIIAAIFLDPFLPLVVKQGFYALSLTIKSLIILLLPVVIFSLLFKATANLAHRATKVILLIFAMVCCSSFVAIFLSHYVGIWIYGFDLSLSLPQASAKLVPAWPFTFPKIIPNEYAMLGGVVLGILVSMVKPTLVPKIIPKLEFILKKILKLFSYLIPLFVTGFIVKLQYEGTFIQIFKDYTMIFLIVACSQYGYVTLAYFLLSRGKIKEFLTSMQNMLPAALAGFGAMSSAAAMPLTLIGVEKNAKNKELVGSVVPATVSIHLLGTCFAIPIFAYAVMKNYGVAEPSLMTYLTFSGYFVITMFSVAAVPAGTIIVMLPILEKYLGFTGEMLSLITALYILLDPFSTGANILGNGAFAKAIDRINEKLKLVKNA